MAEKYWHLSEGRGWNFAADTGKYTEKGDPIRLHLIRAVRIPIRRHPRLKSDVNPFDPAWRDYLEQRALLKRFGPEFVEKHGFLPGNKKRKPVVKTGSASAEL